MHRFPLPTLFVQMDSLESRATWTALQKAVGQGMLIGVVETPETRGAAPLAMELRQHPKAPVDSLADAITAFSALTFTWRKGIESLLNQRWNLVDNPYARFSVVQGAIVVHEDTLGWMIDACAEDLRNGAVLDAPPCAVLVPLPTTQHAVMAAAATPFHLPHAGIFQADLDEAAKENGHDDLAPLAWAPIPARPDGKNVLIA